MVDTHEYRESIGRRSTRGALVFQLTERKGSANARCIIPRDAIKTKVYFQNAIDRGRARRTDERYDL